MVRDVSLLGEVGERWEGSGRREGKEGGGGEGGVGKGGEGRVLSAVFTAKKVASA